MHYQFNTAAPARPLRVYRHTRQHGFTLLEIMIATVIVAVLTAIAYPAYTQQILKTRRSAAQEELMELAEYMERVYTENKTYQPGGSSPGLPFTQSPKDSGTKYYNFSFASISATAYVLQAVPIASGPQDGDGKLTIDNTASKCWDSNDDDTCASSESWH